MTKMTISKAANLLGVSRQLIYNYLKFGLIEKEAGEGKIKIDIQKLKDAIIQMSIGRPSELNKYYICDTNYLDIAQYAKQYSLSISSVYRKVREGKLQAIKINNKLFVQSRQ